MNHGMMVAASEGQETSAQRGNGEKVFLFVLFPIILKIDLDDSESRRQSETPVGKKESKLMFKNKLNSLANCIPINIVAFQT